MPCGAPTLRSNFTGRPADIVPSRGRIHPLQPKQLNYLQARKALESSTAFAKLVPAVTALRLSISRNATN